MSKQDMNASGRRKIRATTVEQKRLRDFRFVEMMATTAITAAEALEALGYSKASAERHAPAMRDRLQDKIVERRMSKLSSKATRAIDEIFKLAMNAQAESVRLRACSDLLDRAGYKSVDRQEIETTVTEKLEDKSTQELEDELDKLLKGTSMTADGMSNISMMPGTIEPDVMLEAEDWEVPENFEDDDWTADKNKENKQ